MLSWCSALTYVPPRLCGVPSALRAELPDVRTSTPVKSVRRQPGGQCGGGAAAGGVTLTTESGDECSFDSVVFATHSDITLQILGEDADLDERRVLQVRYHCMDVSRCSCAPCTPLVIFAPG